MASTEAIKIITGATGTAHITSNDDGEFNQGIWGDGLVVLSNGNKLSATIVDNNTVRIADGDLVFQGRHGLIEAGTVKNMTIDTGSSGTNRIDLICIQYKLTGGVESMNLVVKKGTAGASPSAPSYTTGVIRTGATTAEYPLYKVNISGITISSVERMANVVPYGVDMLKRKINYGTSLPAVSSYNEGDIFLVYEA